MLQRGKEFTRRSLVISCTIFGKDGKKNPFFINQRQQKRNMQRFRLVAKWFRGRVDTQFESKVIYFMVEVVIKGDDN